MDRNPVGAEIPGPIFESRISRNEGELLTVDEENAGHTGI
jgi:hypothetical protein